MSGKGLLADMKYRLYTGFFELCCLLSPTLNTQLHFLRTYRHFANLRKPGTFPEKLSWLKLYAYAEDPLVRRCADKLRVRGYVEEAGLGALLIPLLGVYEKAEDIPWATLPDRFALKWNFGGGMNLLCRDKAALDIPQAVRTLRRWGRKRCWLLYSELQYRVEQKRILCEQFLDTPEGEELLDYKFYCFHGHARAVLVIERPAEGETAAVLMSPDWEFLSEIPGRYSKSLRPARPACLEEMLRAAERLAEPFPFVRVDLYEHCGRVLFGEMTFTPATGIQPSECPIEGKSMGEWIHLEGLQRRGINGNRQN